MSTFSHAFPEHAGTPTPSPEQRIAVVRSLLGHRKPSEHLCNLVVIAAQGATWDELAEADAAVR